VESTAHATSAEAPVGVLLESILAPFEFTGRRMLRRSILMQFLRLMRNMSSGRVDFDAVR
jgi:hypothetical protein